MIYERLKYDMQDEKYFQLGEKYPGKAFSLNKKG
jgi:hypothetical protein